MTPNARPRPRPVREQLDRAVDRVLAARAGGRRQAETNARGIALCRLVLARLIDPAEVPTAGPALPRRPGRRR